MIGARCEPSSAKVCGGFGFQRQSWPYIHQHYPSQISSRYSREGMSYLRASSVLLIFSGLGFGIPCVLAIRNLRAGRDIPYLMGFPAYGGGPFERIGIHTTVPLLAAFMLVCSLEVVAGALLWDADIGGAILAMVLMPLGVFFWWGFALPIPPLFALVRTVLILVNWERLG